jgi:hypothetical protein
VQRAAFGVAFACAGGVGKVEIIDLVGAPITQLVGHVIMPIEHRRGCKRGVGGGGGRVNRGVLRGERAGEHHRGGKNGA